MEAGRATEAEFSARVNVALDVAACAKEVLPDAGNDSERPPRLVGEERWLRKLEDLVRDARAGDRSAFACLLERDTGSAYRAALAILRSPEEAQDVIQEAAVKAWQQLSSLRAADAWPAWFRRIAVRVALDERRHARHLREVRIADTMRPDLTLEAMDRDSNLDLLAAFGRLSAEDRAILALRFYLDLTVPDTADTLGIRLGTAKARLSRAIDRLRAELAR